MLDSFVDITHTEGDRQVKEKNTMTRIDHILSKLLLIEQATYGSDATQLIIDVATDITKMKAEFAELVTELHQSSRYHDNHEYAEGYDAGQINAADSINEIIE